MNWDKIEGEWKQQRGKATHHWGMLMNDDLAAIAGKYDEFVGRLQEKYGVAKEESVNQAKEFKETIERLKKSNSRLIQLQKCLLAKQEMSRKRVETNNPTRKTLRSRSTG